METGAAMDVIDQLAGVVPGSRLDSIRALRPQARENAQKSYLALFAPVDPGSVTLRERFALACFVAGLHNDAVTAPLYAARLVEVDAETELSAAIAMEVSRCTTHGPYGAFPAGPLSRENVVGPRYEVGDASRLVLGPRLATAFTHAHMLVFHPRDASPEALQALLDAGWSTTGIVTISQLVAFLSFQIRVIAGLRVLAAMPVAA
jgi:CMD domain protein